MKVSVGRPPPVVDLRLYRIAFFPALLALVALLFSLQSLPGPLSPLVSPATFVRSTAARYARQLVQKAPDRSPGSTGDAAAADIVEKAFRAVKGGDVLDQRFTSDDVAMRNVVLRLPGSNDRVVALIAPRDTAGGPGATTSAAATGILMELASELGASAHGATLILASTDGSTAGAAGAKELASSLLDSGDVDGVVILADAGVTDRHGPYLLDTADGPMRAGVQLERTAERALSDQAGVSVKRPGALAQLGRLAVPSGLGEQAPLISRGISAVTLSAAGELPVPAAEQGLDSLSPTTVGAFGRAASDTVLSIDAASGGLQPSPGSYIEAGGNLIPGWAVEVLALSLILPALVAAVDALARSAREGHVLEALSWSATRAVPLLGALAALYALALVGIVPTPGFPFAPGTITIGPGEAFIMLVIAGAAWLAWSRLGGNRMPAGLNEAATASALGGMCCLAVLMLWLENPFLGLLATPLAHAWIPHARHSSAPRRLWVVLTVCLACIPIALAVASAASRLGLGASIPWQTLVMVGDGGIPLLVTLPAVALIAWIGALVVACGSAPIRAWTHSLSGSSPVEPISAVKRTSRPDGDGHQDYGISAGLGNKEVERADRPGELPGGLESSGGRDPAEAEPDQTGSPRDPDAPS